MSNYLFFFVMGILAGILVGMFMGVEVALNVFRKPRG
jgi:hypothetical protein